MTSSRDDLLDGIRALRRSRRGGTYAPHQPLLLLWALGRAARGEERLTPYADAQPELDALLSEFGPAAAVQRSSAHLPFWAAGSQPHVWQREISDPAVDPSGRRPTKGVMQRAVSGGLAGGAYQAVREDRELLAAVAGQLLAMLPDSQTAEVLDRCGLDLVASRKKDPTWSKLVLLAYEQRCAICDWDLTLDGKQIGLEAAHVWEWAKGSPNTVDNGVVLCVLHHRAYDRGVIAFSDQRTVLVSQHAIGHHAQGELLRWTGQQLREPQPGHPPISPAYAALHRRSQFREPARSAA